MTHIGVEVVLIRRIRSAILTRRGSNSLFNLPCFPFALLFAALEFTV